MLEKEDILNYYIFNEPALNSFSKKLSDERIKEQNQVFIKETVGIKVQPLYKILDTHLKNHNIDVLNVDVEGMDLDVLNSNDWSKYRPKFVIAVEMLKSNFSEIDKEPIFLFMKARLCYLL